MLLRIVERSASLRRHGRGDNSVWGWLLVQAHGTPEGATLASNALNANIAAHHPAQMFGEGQAETGAPVFAGGGGITLGKWIEDLGLHIRRNADTGIHNVNVNQRVFVLLLVTAHVHHHFAMVGKFHRIANEIAEQLR
jgi:hypothetical protein